jgi:hypothetical protein
MAYIRHTYSIKTALTALYGYYEITKGCDEGGHGQGTEATEPRTTVNPFSLLVDILEWSTDAGCSRDAFDKLLSIISSHFGNRLDKFPSSFHAAWKRLSSFDAPWNKVDLCVNGCVFFEGLHANADECPTCKEPRWDALGESGEVDGGKGRKARSQFFWWDVKFLLARLYANPFTAEMMRAHARHVPPKDGTVRTIWGK